MINIVSRNRMTCCIFAFVYCAAEEARSLISAFIACVRILYGSACSRGKLVLVLILLFVL